MVAAAAISAMFIMLLICAAKGVYIGYALFAGLVLLAAAACAAGHSARSVGRAMAAGAAKSLRILEVFLLIGALTAAWLESGTVPAMVYYGLQLLKPETFILAAFITSAAASLLMGSAFGTSGTVGVAFMLIARSGGVSVPAAAGAVIAGAYFGDRCSPLSSSANLVACVTRTDIYGNMKNMLRTSAVPLALSLGFYLAVSALNPMEASKGAVAGEILDSFYVGLPVLVPAAVVIAFSLLRINVRLSMAASIASAVMLAALFQGRGLESSAVSLLTGFEMEKSGPLQGIMKGGGMLPMAGTCFIMLAASALAGLIEETGLLGRAEAFTQNAASRFQVYRNVLVTSILTSAVGCCQAFTIILTNVLNSKSYEKNGLDCYDRASDLENTSVVVSALIPWNVSLLLPLAILGADYSCYPYLAYIYLIPLWNLVYFSAKSKWTYGIIRLNKCRGGLTWGAKLWKSISQTILKT
jgi:NhaC family Na+:H+ antiporter